MKKVYLLLLISTAHIIFAHDFINYDDSNSYDRVNDHILTLESHLEKMDDLFNEIEALKSAQHPFDIELQRLTMARNKFNKIMCPPGTTPRLAFYVYTRDKQNEALEKLNEHRIIVRQHLEALKAERNIFENAVNPSYSQYMRLMNLWVDQFMKTQCNAVGFGYIID